MHVLVEFLIKVFVVLILVEVLVVLILIELLVTMSMILLLLIGVYLNWEDIIKEISSGVWDITTLYWFQVETVKLLVIGESPTDWRGLLCVKTGYCRSTVIQLVDTTLIWFEVHTNINNRTDVVWKAYEYA